MADRAMAGSAARLFIALAVLGGAKPSLAAPHWTQYVYVGNRFTVYNINNVTYKERVRVSFILPGALAVSTLYTALPAGAINAHVSFSGAPHAPPFRIPISIFELATDAHGAIVAWEMFGQVEKFRGPTMVFFNAYTLNTLTYGVPILPGVTGHYAVDQAVRFDAPGRSALPSYGGVANPSAGTWHVVAGTPD